MEPNELKRKNRSPVSNNAFAAPRPKRQRTKSPISSTRNFECKIHENKYNVSYSYLYDVNGIIPSKHLLNSIGKCIEIRIPISLLSFNNNLNINCHKLWGGGSINNYLYSSDSDIICILYHLGIISKYGMNTDFGFDTFCILNKILSQNVNGNKNDEDIDRDYDFMYIRKSTHKLNIKEIEYEQNRNLTKNKLYKILGNNDMIGIAVIFDVFQGLKEYKSININGYYSQKWINKNNEIKTSLRLKYIYPLTNFNEFVIDNNYLYPMIIKKIENKNNGYHKYELIKKMDKIGFVFNLDKRPCLKYNISIIGNANLLLNQIDFINQQKERIKKHKIYKKNNKIRINLRNNNNDKINHNDDDDDDIDNNHNNDDNDDIDDDDVDDINNNHNDGDIDDDDDDDVDIDNIDIDNIDDNNNNLNKFEYNDNEKRYGHLLQFRLEKFILMMENEKNKCQYQLILNTKKTTNNNKYYKFIQIQQQKLQNKIADHLNWNDIKWSNKGIKINNKLYEIDKVWLIKK